MSKKVYESSVNPAAPDADYQYGLLKKTIFGGCVVVGLVICALIYFQ